MSRLGSLDSTLEQQRLDRQSKLDNERSKLERNQLGQFATPSELADEIAEFVLSLLPSEQSIRFLEPSVGSGSFFNALLNRKGSRKIIQATGLEIDNRFSELAAELWNSKGLLVRNEDFFAATPATPKADLLIGNPPYVRHHHIDLQRKKQLQEAVRRQLGIKISGLAGLYCYFVLLADRWLADNAFSAWLIPSEFMDVNYGKALRDYLTKHVTLHQIHRYCPTEDKFNDALVSSAVVVFQKRKPSVDLATTLSFGGPIGSPRVVTRISNEKLQLETRWTRLAGSSSQSRVKQRSSPGNEHLTVGDLFTVKRGIATGANGFFILPRGKANELELPNQFLKPILPSPRYLKTEVIERYNDGYPQIEKQLVLLDCPLQPEIIKHDYPKLWSYLLKGIENNIPMGFLTSRRDPWYSQEQRKTAPFLCSYMGRSESRPFRFFWNKSDAIAANVFLLLYPKPALVSKLNSSHSLAAEIFESLAQVKPADFFDEGRVYGGGLYKLEPSELKEIPLKGLTIRIDNNVQKSLW